MPPRPILPDPPVPPGTVIREATPADNDALVALERETPLVVGDSEEYFDRAPDYFANRRLHQHYRAVVAEADGRIVGVTAALVHTPLIQGKPRCLMYIHRGRVAPEAQRQGVGFAMSTALFRWGGTLGAEGPYYLISPDNERSIAFGGRAGRRWPTDVTLVTFETGGALDGETGPVAPDETDDAVRLINATHTGEEFFEPLTAASMRARLSRDRQYSGQCLFGERQGGRLVAVAGLCDKGAATERIHVDRTTGATTRTREAVIVDWGYEPGREEAFARLIRGLAVRARLLGRPVLTVCEPVAGTIPDTGLPASRADVAIFTPAMDPPARNAIRGMFFDLLFL